MSKFLLALLLLPAAAAELTFQEFKLRFGKNYASIAEDAQRLDVFLMNLEELKETKAGLTKEQASVFGVTKFFDETKEEFKRSHLNYHPVAPARDVPVRNQTARSTKSAVNWMAAGATTAVKNQAYCGSCWAFSAVEQIESAWKLAGNPLTEFSTEQVVACDSVDAGCNGGDSPSAYDYVIEAGGLATEAAYPYSDGDGTTSKCAASFDVVGAGVKSYEYVATPCNSFRCTDTDEAMLQSSLDEAPASICVNAEKWNAYTGGVMDSSTCGKNGFYALDHCVQLVGYDSTAATPYWIVRNSWDTNWGSDCGNGGGGCIYLTMGENTCGVAVEAMTVGF